MPGIADTVSFRFSRNTGQHKAGRYSNASEWNFNARFFPDEPVYSRRDKTERNDFTVKTA